MRCDDVLGVLPSALDGPAEAALDHDARRHLGSCLRCQAELARYRRMLRALELLRTRYVAPAPGLLAATLAALDDGVDLDGRPSPLGKRIALAGAALGASAMAAAGATAVIVARSRRRGRLPLAG